MSTHASVQPLTSVSIVKYVIRSLQYRVFCIMNVFKYKYYLYAIYNNIRYFTKVW